MDVIVKVVVTMMATSVLEMIQPMMKMTIIIMRIPKNCSFYCISMSAISHDLTRCVESTKIGGNPKAVNKISQAQNSLKLPSSLQ